MDWRDGVLSEVAQGMNIRNFDFGETGVACFEMENTGSLFMEQKEEGVLMYFAYEIDTFNMLSIMESALSECHYKNSFPYTLQVGLQENRLFICLFLHNSSFNRSSVASAMTFLINKAEELK